ncbi:hypothetical protein [Burkholderia ubonensis]|uniref:hypothetical protein n=1 Tax=Burkholderia ubonensis TaxID=101571 RepID=UPI0012FC20AC|nr:hypothetical protein [Burkholderia ubonensis]
MKALLILWLKSLAVFIGVVLVLATMHQWDEVAHVVSVYGVQAGHGNHIVNPAQPHRALRVRERGNGSRQLISTSF